MSDEADGENCMQCGAALLEADPDGYLCRYCAHRGARVLSLDDARDSRKHVFDLCELPDDRDPAEAVWISKGVQESAGQERIALEGPPDADGWAMSPAQARAIAAALLERAAQLEGG